jgi:NIMA (never in mitosis gene a)-related kinase
MQNLSEKEKHNALNEVWILASISDENIIGYKEAFFDESSSSLCIIMEFADDGDLY